MFMQSAIALIYPHHCATCDAQVRDPGMLCGACWRDTPFIMGLCCNGCGAPLPGDEDAALLCDDCLTFPRPWSRGRAALVYKDRARTLVLQIKHADRMDLIPAAAGWMAQAVGDLVTTDTLIVPVPAHWMRLLSRRYNQAAALGTALAHHVGCNTAPRALVRTRKTSMQDGKNVATRFADLEDSMAPHPTFGAVVGGRDILLVDDVMTSGATLAAATEACLRAGAAKVDVATLARVVKDA